MVYQFVHVYVRVDVDVVTQMLLVFAERLHPDKPHFS